MAYFVNHETGANAGTAITAKMLYDDTYFYILYTSKDDDLFGSGDPQQTDPAVFNTDDVFEIFIDPDGNELDYAEINVSLTTAVYDAIINSANPFSSQPSWDPQFDLGVNVSGTLNNNGDLDQGWSAELRIPFSSLAYNNSGFSGTIQSGDVWRLNHYAITRGESAATEYLSWNVIGSFGFHSPANFGTVSFDNEIVTDTKASVSNEVLAVFPTTLRQNREAVHLSGHPERVQIVNANGLSRNCIIDGDMLRIPELNAGIYYIVLHSKKMVVRQRILIE
jgi:hypothetical protein